jgi:hypothetical protein
MKKGKKFTLEEALAIRDSYSTTELETFERMTIAYLRVADLLNDPNAKLDTRDKYELVRREYGGKSTGITAKYLPVVEVIEKAKQQSEHQQAPSADTATAKSAPEPVRQKIEGVRAAMDVLSSTIVETIASREAELAASYQRMFDDQKTALVRELSDTQAEKDGLARLCIAAGNEAEEHGLRLEEARSKLDSVTGERDAAHVQLAALVAKDEVTSTKLSAAEAQIATHVRAAERCSAELDRLLREREPLARDAEGARELKSERDRLRRRLDEAEVRKRELAEELTAAKAREQAADEKHEQEVRLLRQRITNLEEHLSRAHDRIVAARGE